MLGLPPRSPPLGLPDFALEVFFSEWEFKARHHLCASDAQAVTVKDLLALARPELREAFENCALGYIETFGTPRLREAIARTYRGLTADDVLVFAGAEEGLFCALHALLGKGDHAIVTVPNYQSMESVPVSLCEVSGVTLRPENAWRLDLLEVKRALKANTRVVAVNFPNNPTGAIPDRRTFEALVALCEERGVWLFSDEVYRGLELDPSRRLPQAAELSARALSLGVMSKAYGLPGLRVGWIACRDRALLARMEKLKHYLSICNASPSEVLATIALENAEVLMGANRARVAANVGRVSAFFARHPELYSWSPPDGGCVAFAQYKGADGADAHFEALARRAGVLLLPSSRFQSKLGSVPADRFRIGLGRDGMEAGLAAWEGALR
jgi:aspartate/methionine/tyrosine aminotransferase